MTLRHVGVAAVTCLQREHGRRQVLLAEPAALLVVNPGGILQLMMILEALVDAESGSRAEVVDGSILCIEHSLRVAIWQFCSLA